MKQLKIIAFVSFIIMCFAITMSNLSMTTNATPLPSPRYNNVGNVSYETKTINGHSILFVTYGTDVEILKLQ